MAKGLEALLRSAQAALSAASATLPPPKSGAQKLMAESLAVSGAGAVALLEVGANSHDSTMHAPTHPIDRSQCIPSMLASHRRANQSIPCLDRARALTR